MVVETQASPLQDGGPGDSEPKLVDKVVVRFAGDSGDGMQVTGSFFTHNSALAGNDISTLPDFPAEIRAPAGTLPGVSGFQLNFSSLQIMTPGDTPEVDNTLDPHDLILGACVGHLVLKTQFNHHLNTYIHFVSFISMMLVADVARASGHSLLLAGAVTHMASYLLRGEGGLQEAFRLHPQLGPEEISASLLAAATWMLGQALVERYQATSPLY